MKIGLQINRFDWPWRSAIGPTLARIVRSADDAGFDSLWVRTTSSISGELAPPRIRCWRAGRRSGSWRPTRAAQGWG